MKACVYVENKSQPSLAAIGSALDCITNDKIDTLPSAVYNEIELIDVLEYDERPEILQLVASKIRHGGSIKIIGTEVRKMLESVGFQIQFATISGNKYLLEALRP